MGGHSYTRSYHTASAGASYSDVGDSTMRTRRRVATSLLPASRSRCRELVCTHQNPIVDIIDVTGSMGDWSKIIFDKLPVFIGQIMQHGYLSDPSISYAAVGDAVYPDSAPFQVCDFEHTTALDNMLSQIWLESGGGSQHHESYQDMAYFYARHCTLHGQGFPFLFFNADEAFYDTVDPQIVRKHFKDSIQPITAREIFRELCSKFNVFLLHKPYGGGRDSLDRQIVEEWREAIGNRVVILRDPKANIDMKLGIIAILSGTRTLSEYLNDMRDREQTQERIELVRTALEPILVNGESFDPRTIVGHPMGEVAAVSHHDPTRADFIEI